MNGYTNVRDAEARGNRFNIMKFNENCVFLRASLFFSFNCNCLTPSLP
jgi:hypothetical protein